MHLHALNLWSLFLRLSFLFCVSKQLDLSFSVEFYTLFDFFVAVALLITLLQQPIKSYSCFGSVLVCQLIWFLHSFSFFIIPKTPFKSSTHNEYETRLMQLSSTKVIVFILKTTQQNGNLNHQKWKVITFHWHVCAKNTNSW